MSQANPAATTDRSATADRILDLAQDRIQQRGYNAVSYGDLAEDLDLTTAAIHYHFPSKADLGQALVARYRRVNAQERAAIVARTEDLRGRLRAYVALYADILEDGGFCLCGGLVAAESALPEAVQREVRRFFADQEDWLTTIIAEGETDPAGLNGCETPREVAALFLAAVEGAMLTSRDRPNAPEAYRDSLQNLIDTITG
jgi:TetR/AcrR family transcriptional repressor of nem operon